MFKEFKVQKKSETIEYYDVFHEVLKELSIHVLNGRILIKDLPFELRCADSTIWIYAFRYATDISGISENRALANYNTYLETLEIFADDLEKMSDKWRNSDPFVERLINYSEFSQFDNRYGIQKFNETRLPRIKLFSEKKKEYFTHDEKCEHFKKIYFSAKDFLEKFRN
jgi:hypothetical protein